MAAKYLSRDWLGVPSGLGVLEGIKSISVHIPLDASSEYEWDYEQ